MHHLNAYNCTTVQWLAFSYRHQGFFWQVGHFNMAVFGDFGVTSSNCSLFVFIFSVRLVLWILSFHRIILKKVSEWKYYSVDRLIEREHSEPGNHPCNYHFFSLFIQFTVAERLEPFPAFIGWKVGYSLDRMPVYPRANRETDIHSHLHQTTSTMRPVL